MTAREPGRFVAYLRVSTDGQGRSGLGLEAQRQAVAAYVAQVGGDVAQLEIPSRLQAVGGTLVEGKLIEDRPTGPSGMLSQTPAELE
jgi:hypothetical protein